MPVSRCDVKSAILGACVGLLSFPVLADDWPLFRGPQQDGISRESDFDPSGIPTVKWKAEVGLGYSAPVISEGRLVIAGHAGGKDTLFCFDEASGDVKWEFSYPQPLGDLYFQGGTTGSATLAGGFVYFVAREGETFCLKLEDGSIVWQKHLQTDFGFTKPTWGFSGAPLVRRDRVYLTAGESGIALAAADGSLIWKSDDEEAGYSTPFPIQRNGRDYLIFTNKRHYVCVEEENGTEVWKHRWMTRYGVNAADPIVSDDHILISSGYGKGAVLLNWDGNGNPDRVWQSRELRTQMNAAVRIGDYVYGVDGNESQDGTGLKCLNWKTGETMWANFNVGHGTVTAVGETLIVLTE
ncbi:MAG: PQQ-binding-like beta-propeller repeat protein, partial [Verrucomicrobiota bacterium]